MRKLLTKSLVNFIGKDKFVFILFCICQVVSIISIMFVYGLIVAKNQYNDSFTVANRQFNIPMEEKITSLKFMNKINALKNDLRMNSSIDNIAFWFAFDSDILIKANIEFKTPAALYIDNGKYYTAQDYDEGNKVIIINQTLTGDVHYNVGDYYTLGEDRYLIIGMFGQSYFEIPYTAINSVDSLVNITITLKNTKDIETIEKYSEVIKETLGVSRVELPLELSDDSIGENLFQTVSSIFIALLAAINFSALYRYILKKRQKEYAIYRICGCTNTKGFILFLSELIIVCVVLFVVCALIFQLFLSNIYAFMKEGVSNAMVIKDYIALLALYLANILIVFAPIIKKYSDKSPVETYHA